MCDGKTDALVKVLPPKGVWSQHKMRVAARPCVLDDNMSAYEILEGLKAIIELVKIIVIYIASPKK